MFIDLLLTFGYVYFAACASLRISHIGGKKNENEYKHYSHAVSESFDPLGSISDKSEPEFCTLSEYGLKNFVSVFGSRVMS